MNTRAAKTGIFAFAALAVASTSASAIPTAGQLEEHLRADGWAIWRAEQTRCLLLPFFLTAAEWCVVALVLIMVPVAYCAGCLPSNCRRG